MRRVWLFVLASCAASDDSASSTLALNVCPPAVVEGIDVAAGQGDIAWNDVARTRSFAFIKATQGTYNVQRTFADHFRGAKLGGVIRGAYHFFDPTEDGAEQARFFLRALDAAGGLQPGDLPPMLDLECPSHAREDLAAKTCLYAGGSGWAPPDLLRARAQTWLDAVERATGRKPVLYSYVSWFENAGFIDPAAPKRLADYPLFIASLATCPSVPAPWTLPTFWQYSFTGSVTGIDADVDLDRFVGTPAELAAFTLARNSGADAGDGGADAGDGGADAGDGGADAGDGSRAEVDSGSAAGDAPLVVVESTDPHGGDGEGCNVHADRVRGTCTGTGTGTCTGVVLALIVVCRRRRQGHVPGSKFGGHVLRRVGCAIFPMTDWIA